MHDVGHRQPAEHRHDGDCCADHDHDGHHHHHGARGEGAEHAAAPVAGSRAWAIAGMDCASCAGTIRTALERLPGVTDIRISVTNETLSLVLDETQTSGETVEGLTRKLGYPATPLRTDALAPPAPVAEPHRHAKHRLTLVAAAAVLVAYAAGFFFPAHHDGLFIAATLVAGVPVARRAIAAAAAGAFFTIEMLMSIAVVGAIAIGAAEEAAVVVVLFCIGEMLEGVAANRARAGIRALGALVPQTALVDVEGRFTEVPAASLTAGQVVLVRPGDRIPGDGTVILGVSGVDESPITGESEPRSKAVGDAVFAGSINQDASLTIRVERAARDTMIARIVALVEEAQEAKAPTERFIDRFARIYMPIILGLSVAVATLPPLVGGADWATWIYRGLALLLIGCPCALVISVPAAIASSLAAAAREGLLIKGGAVMERLAAIQTIAFDKTGTLTQGRPEVTDILPLAGDAGDVLSFAAALERESSHPLAVAIARRAEAEGAPARVAADVTAMPGRGVTGTVAGAAIFVGSPRHAAERTTLDAADSRAVARLEEEGKTAIVVIRDGAAIGIIALRDEPRADAAEAVRALKALGIAAIMLTGDNARVGAAIAGALGIAVQAEMLPAGKADAVKALAASTRVAMVGDGINDAPALASADVGIAMGSGTDVALEAADAALLHNRIGDVVALVRISRATMANIRQNIAIALGLKGLFLVTTIIGATGLWVAILADTGGTVLVTLNALRLLGYFRSRPRMRAADA